MHIDHAGIATAEAERVTELYADVFGCEVAHEETFDGLGVVFLDFGNGYLELLEPRDGDGPIASYLEGDGPGLHHLALATEDIEAAIEGARDAGVELIDERPREGAWGHNVAFLHPASTGGVLFEFVQH